MKIVERVKHLFSSGESTGSIPATYDYTKSQNLSVGEKVMRGAHAPAHGAIITTSLADFLIGLTKFEDLNERDIYEQMFVWEPEVASVVNKVGEMVRASFDCFMIIDDSNFDNIPKDLSIAVKTEPGDDDQFDDITIGKTKRSNLSKRDEMKDTANEISRQIDVPSIIETWANVLYMQGEIFLEVHPNLSLTIIPNNRVTILDDEKRIDLEFNPNVIITEEKVLVIDERLPTQRVLQKNQFIHVKLSDVPLNILDPQKRQTYGIYGISPLHRAITAIWMKRQSYIIRTLWGWGNIPREHHVVNAEAFSFDKMPGTPAQKKIAAEKAMRKFIIDYASGLKTDAPDQKYVTSSNIEIRNVEHAGNAFMDDKDFIDQINSAVWDALGMPPSVIRGLSDGSYASEIIVASGASLRIEQIARKLGRVILENMRERLTIIDPSYPVNLLDIKISFEVAESRLEKGKIAQLKKELGVYTPTEIREELNSMPLTENQITEEGLVTSGNTFIVKSIDELSPDYQTNLQTKSQIQVASAKLNGGGQTIRSDGKVNYPTTSHSANQQPTDSGDNVSKKVLYK